MVNDIEIKTFGEAIALLEEWKEKDRTRRFFNIKRNLNWVVEILIQPEKNYPWSRNFIDPNLLEAVNKVLSLYKE